MHELFPREVTTNVPRVILTGAELLEVEQHRGLVTCSDGEISLQTASGLLTVTGTGLHLRRYSMQEAVIAGRIGSVSLTQEGRRR